MSDGEANGKPVAIPPDFDRIPAYFRDRNQWVLWRFDLIGGRWTKVPFTVKGYRAMTNQPATWTDFAAVRLAYASGKWDGIGYCRSGREMFFDLDGCFNADGTFAVWNWGDKRGPQPDQIVALLENSCYIERSVSGLGLHAIGIGQGAIPSSTQRDVPGAEHAGYALYAGSRFFTFTGSSWFEGDLENDCLPAAQKILEMFEAKPAEPVVSGPGEAQQAVPDTPLVPDEKRPLPQLVPDAPLSDSEVLTLILRDRKAGPLFSSSNGEGLGILDSSPSGLDFHLCQRLAFYCQGNQSQIDGLFRRSALYANPERAEKWDSPRNDSTYGAETIRKATEITSEFYKRRPKRGTKAASSSAAPDAPPDSPGEPPPEKRDEPASDGFPMTDLGNAQRFQRRYGETIRYLAPAKAWHIWDGKCWRRDESLTIEHLAGEMAQSLWRSDSAELRKWGAASQGERKLKATVNLARSFTELQIAADQLDSHPWLLNCTNGTLDLRTGQLREHRMEDYLTHVINCDYDPLAHSAKWISFLESALPDREIREFLQRSIGYSLTGSTREECCFLLTGEGRNGKGTMLLSIGEVLGRFLTATASFATFVRTNREHSGEIANMRGKRLIVAQEASSGSTFSESILKGLTGGDRVSGRRLYENQMDFLMQGKIWLVTNILPEVRDFSTGFWSRLFVIEFPVSFAGNENKNLKAELGAQDVQRAILAWAVEGCMRWLEEGLAPPEAVRIATAEYREESDLLGKFLIEQCEQHSELTAQSRPLYAAYSTYCEGANERPMTETAFGRAMKAKGWRKRHTNHGAEWLGLQTRKV